MSQNYSKYVLDPGTAQKRIPINNPAFTDLRRANISSSTTHDYIEWYNILEEHISVLNIQTPTVLDKQLMA